MKKDAQKNLTLVAYYGRKSARINNFINELKEQLIKLFGCAFTPYTNTQVHATVVSLEGWWDGDCLLNRNYAELQGKQEVMDISGMLSFIDEHPDPLLTVRIGGFKKSMRYSFTSRDLHPYYRSFGIHDEIAVVMGWPVEQNSYPMTLDTLRRVFNRYGILHKYHITEDHRDNDLFFVVGRVDNRNLSKKRINEVEEEMRFYMAEIMERKYFTVRKRDLSLVVYTETTLNARKSKKYPLDTAEKNLEEILKHYPSATSVPIISVSKIKTNRQRGKSYITKKSGKRHAKVKNEHEKQYPLSQRRKFLVTAGWGIALTGPSGWVFRLWDKFKLLASNPVPSIEKLFPFWKDVQLVPGQVHPIDGFHPDVEYAQKKIVPLMHKSTPIECLSLGDLPEPSLHSDLLLVGGPITNPLSCKLHAYEFIRKQKISLKPQRNIGTRWCFYYPERTPKDKSFSRYVNKKLRPTWPKAIIDRSGRPFSTQPLYPKIDPETEQILSDYLLITVVPNTMRTDSTGATVIDVADLCGQGDKVFSDVIEDPELLGELNEERKGKRYFQALYEVPVEHDDENCQTIAKKPKLIGLFRPGKD